MLGWAAFLASSVGPLAKRVLAALGLGFVVWAGADALKAQVGAAVASAWSGVGADVYQVLALAGIVDAMGVWLGALTAIVALLAFKQLGVLAS